MANGEGGSLSTPTTTAGSTYTSGGSKVRAPLLLDEVEVKTNDPEKSSYADKALDSQTNPEGFRPGLQKKIDDARTLQEETRLKGKQDRLYFKDKLKTEKKEQQNLDKMNRLRERKGLAPIAPGSVDPLKGSFKEEEIRKKISEYMHGSQDSAIPESLSGEGGLEGLLGVSGDIQL